jgi:hypothetical protein
VFLFKTPSLVVIFSFALFDSPAHTRKNTTSTFFTSYFCREMKAGGSSVAMNRHAQSNEVALLYTSSIAKRPVIDSTFVQIINILDTLYMSTLRETERD